MNFLSFLRGGLVVLPFFTWIVEYSRGVIPTMLPFGIADSLFSTLDYKTVVRSFRIYGKHVIKNLLRERPP